MAAERNLGGEADNFPYTVGDAYSYLDPRKNETTTGPYFPGDTTFGSGGPRDTVAPALGFFLGACVDTEGDGQPSLLAADSGVRHS